MGPSSPPKWKKRMGSLILTYFVLKKTTKKWIALLKKTQKLWIFGCIPQNLAIFGGGLAQRNQAQRDSVNLDFC